MTLQRRIGLGVTLGVDAAGASNYALLGNIVNAITFSGGKATIVDMSILSDIFVPKAKGQIDGGKVGFEVCYDKGETNTTLLLTTLWANTGVNPPTWQVTYPATSAENAETCNFSAWLSGAGVSIDKGKMIVAPIELDISGNPGF